MMSRIVIFLASAGLAGVAGKMLLQPPSAKAKAIVSSANNLVT
jgi:hypothetical protein